MPNVQNLEKFKLNLSVEEISEKFLKHAKEVQGNTKVTVARTKCYIRKDILSDLEEIELKEFLEKNKIKFKRDYQDEWCCFFGMLNMSQSLIIYKPLNELIDILSAEYPDSAKKYAHFKVVESNPPLEKILEKMLQHCKPVKYETVFKIESNGKYVLTSEERKILDQFLQQANIEFTLNEEDNKSREDCFNLLTTLTACFRKSYDNDKKMIFSMKIDTLIDRIISHLPSDSSLRSSLSSEGNSNTQLIKFP